MKKSISIIAAAAMAASLTLAGAVTSFAADEETTTQAATEAAATYEPSVKLTDIAGKWIYQEADGNTTVDKAAKNNGVVEVSDNGAFTYTNAAGTAVSGTVNIGYDEIEGTYLDTVKFDTGSDDTSFTGYYRSDSKQITIGNGGMIRLVREDAQAAETTTTAAAETTAAASSETTTTAATTTTSAGTTTTKSAGTTTTKAGSKSGNPKTGVEFPAVAVSGLAVAAVSVAFALRKKED